MADTIRKIRWWNRVPCLLKGHDFYKDMPEGDTALPSGIKLVGNNEQTISFYCNHEGITYQRQMKACKRCGVVTSNYIIEPEKLTEDEKMVRDIIL